MKKKTIPFYKPSLPEFKPAFGDGVFKDIKKMYSSGMLAPGAYTERLVNSVKERLGVSYIVPFSNCSDALIALLSNHRRKYVAMPAFTFSATWQALEWNQCRCLLVDVLPDGNMDPVDLQRVIDLAPIDAILGVHMFGNPSLVNEYQHLADRAGANLYFDCAHGMGASFQGTHLGNFGKAEVLSIGTTKCLPAGEGGIVATNDKEIYAYMKMAAIHGHPSPTPYNSSLDVFIPSLNGRIQEFNSIIAFHGMKKLDTWVDLRNNIAQVYDDHFSDDPDITPVISPRPQNRCSYKDYPILVGKTREDKLNIMGKLYDHYGIATKEYYYPAVPDYRMINDSFSPCLNKNDGFIMARKLASNAMSIPIYPSLTERDQEYIINSIREVIYDD